MFIQIMSCNQLNNNRCNCKPVDLNCQATEYAPETSSPKLKCNCGPLPGKCLQNGNQIIAAPRYHFKEIKRFYQDCLIVCGALSEQAHTQAETLFDADLRGHPYHGMGRLGMLYIFVMLEDKHLSSRLQLKVEAC